MTETYDYSGEIPLPKPEETRDLAQLIQDLWDAELAVDVTKEALDAAKQKVLELKRFAIPDMMTAMHMEEFSNAGLKVKLKKDVFAGITVERTAAAHAWLEEHGHGGLIKRELAVAFAMQEGDKAAQLRAELDQKYPGNVKQEEWVEPQSLKAFVRKQLEAGVKDFPLELFGAQEFREAKVERKK